MLSQDVFAQERKILRGRVIVDSIQNSIGIHVVNLTAETGTSTGYDGVFSILAKVGDTLFFSSVQFEHSRVVVEQSLLQQFLEVRLLKKFNELDEVHLDDIRLSGDIAKDIDLVPKSVYEKLGISFPKPRRTSLELATHSAYNGGSITNILNFLNGSFSQLKKADNNRSRSSLVDKGFNLLGETYFVSNLGIEAKEIFNFLYYCAEVPEYSELTNSKKIFDPAEFLETKIVSFKELRQLD